MKKSWVKSVVKIDTVPVTKIFFICFCEYFTKYGTAVQLHICGIFAVDMAVFFG